MYRLQFIAYFHLKGFRFPPAAQRTKSLRNSLLKSPASGVSLRDILLPWNKSHQSNHPAGVLTIPSPLPPLPSPPRPPVSFTLDFCGRLLKLRKRLCVFPVTSLERIADHVLLHSADLAEIRGEKSLFSFLLLLFPHRLSENRVYDYLGGKDFRPLEGGECLRPAVKVKLFIRLCGAVRIFFKLVI